MGGGGVGAFCVASYMYVRGHLGHWCMESAVGYLPGIN